MNEKKSPPLAGPIILSVLILSAGAVIGWRQDAARAEAGEIHRRVAREARELGVLDSDLPSKSGSNVAATRSRHEKQDGDARAFAKDLIALAAKMKAAEEAGEDTDEMQKEGIAMMDRLLALDARQMKIVIEEIHSSNDLEDEPKREIIMMTIMMLSQQDPVAALDLISGSLGEEGDAGMREQTIAMTLQQLAMTDPLRAAEWLRENEKNNPDLVPEHAKTQIVAGLAMTDPRMALEMMEEFEVEDVAYWQLARGARTAEQREILLSALRQKGNEELTAQVLSSLPASLLEEGFDGATDWIAQSELTDGEREALTNGLAFHWTGDDTGRWIEWVDEQGGENADLKTNQLMREWTEQDFQAAADWLAQAPPGELKHQSVAAFATTVAPYEPASAADWARTLPAGPERQAVARQIVDSWQTLDPQAAATFAKQEGLD